MFYCLRYEYKKLLWFIFGLFCGLLIGRYDFKNLLLEDAHAIGPTNWYNSKQMNLYSSLIVNSSNTTIDNGTNVVSDNIPMINFNQITTNNLDLMFAPTLVVKDYSYQLQVYSCGMSRLNNDLRTGAENTNMSTASNLEHSTSWVSNPTTSYSGPSGCKIDTFVFKVEQTGVYFKIGIQNNSTYANFRILGYTLENVSKSSTGGASSQDILNSQNTIINSINSNANSNNSQIISNNNSNFNTLNSNLTDDFLTSSVGDDFFDDERFDNNNDIVSLVTTPLDIISSLINSSCSPITLPLNVGGTTNNINLPCMQPILRTHANSIVNLWQVFIGGILCYYAIIIIVKSTTKALDPTNASVDYVEL